jgi:hypothetical protein
VTAERLSALLPGLESLTVPGGDVVVPGLDDLRQRITVYDPAAM